MRTISIVVAVFAVTTASARAGSFVTIAAPEPGSARSIVVLGGAPAPVADAAAKPMKVAARHSAKADKDQAMIVKLAFPMVVGEDIDVAMTRVSPSIIAFGTPDPAVTDERVAAIPRSAAMPMVIRGGISGDLYTAAPQAASGGKTATPINTGGPSGKPPGAGRTLMPDKQQAKPEPQAAPTGNSMLR